MSKTPKSAPLYWVYLETRSKNVFGSNGRAAKINMWTQICGGFHYYPAKTWRAYVLLFIYLGIAVLQICSHTFWLWWSETCVLLPTFKASCNERILFHLTCVSIQVDKSGWWVTSHVLISSVLLLIVSKSVLRLADMFPWNSLLRLLLLLICWCFLPQLSDDLEPSCLENNKTDPPVVPYGRLASHHVERTNKCIGYWISWLNFWY